jgi:hypothetical protein
MRRLPQTQGEDVEAERRFQPPVCCNLPERGNGSSSMRSDPRGDTDT